MTGASQQDESFYATAYAISICCDRGIEPGDCVVRDWGRVIHLDCLNAGPACNADGRTG